METLAPWAVLEVGILTARDLTERDAGYFSTDIAPDSFVQVLMDDRPLEKCKTTVARAKSEPMWIYNCEVEIMAPMSMLRFQVKDNRPSEQDAWPTQWEGRNDGLDVDIGFFDICVGDIPYHQDIEGWFELRFQESLLSTSVDRYNNHCQAPWIPVGYDWKKRPPKQVNNSTALMDIPDDDHETKLVQKKQRYSSSKERALDAFQACVQSTADKAEAYGFESLSKAMTEGKRKRRSNAGELYVSLRLKLLVSKADSMFAYALDPPLMVNYGGLKQEVTLSKQVDMQRPPAVGDGCYDDFYEVKAPSPALERVSVPDTEVHVLDNALLCCAYGFRYLVSWRSTLLSLMPGIKEVRPPTSSSTYQGLLLALSLCINSFTEARQYMTRGGLNAPLTEEGFKQTAAWRDSGEVLKFIERLLREDMTPGVEGVERKAIVEDPKGQLKAFAAQCVRDGKPTLSLEEARLALLAADYVEDQKVYFRRGDLVWVDGRYPARVESSSGDLVKVSYETLGFADSKNPSPKIPRRSRNCRWICFPTQIQPVAKGKLICFCYLLLFFPREKPR
ncbi:C2 domain-containing protein [Durusdinium trenchii]|uniref:C2 domain-containing protein n=1 Tax=Durusdinium trenchii TaxID=1381693 RepID=A0ABP0QKM1_9DINO